MQTDAGSGIDIPVRYYPIFLDIKRKPCVVIGGGNVAERKVLSLLDAGAKVLVISPKLTSALKRLAGKKTIGYRNKSYEQGDLKGFFLAYSATNDPAANESVFHEAKKRGILLNVVDVPELCNFIVPSVVDRGDLLIAISTSGRSPAMAKKIRQQLEKEFGWEYAAFLEIMGKVRDKILTLDKSSDALSGTKQSRCFDETKHTICQGLTKSNKFDKNKKIFESIVNSPMLEWIRHGKKKEIDKFIKEALEKAGSGL
ncbi:MAG: bifunctional precorrin-2 dehydrogenase/sirohydrochlorin ferrochelatase [Deltaproteobacteria bacterium]|nr:bifunctional precorrin-2 dehydrogenase/sirohydrochlorin ferrochelatase [Deltaproteobacteria bacterium]